MACRQADKLVAPAQKERIGGDNDRVDTPLRKGCESRVEMPAPFNSANIGASCRAPSTAPPR
jgi:hypothetical protein